MSERPATPARAGVAGPCLLVHKPMLPSGSFGGSAVARLGSHSNRQTSAGPLPSGTSGGVSSKFLPYQLRL